MEGKNWKIIPAETYKKVGRRNIMNDLFDIAEKEGLNLETTRFVYENKDDKEVYSTEVKK